MALPLPDEHVAESTPREIATNAVGVLVLFIVANVLALWWLSGHTVNLSTFILQSKWSLLEELKQPADWLVVGDSSGNQGVNTSLLEEELGGTAVNLCTVADMGLVDDAWMVDEHIRRLGAPRNVIVVHVYDTWHRKDNQMRDVLISVRPPIDWRNREPQIDLDSGDRRDILIAEYFTAWLPLYSQNASLKYLVMHPVAANGPAPFELDETGFMPRAEATPENVERDVASHERFLGKRSFSVSDTNEAGLARLLELSASHGFPLYIVNGPAEESLAAGEKYRAYFAELQQWLAAQLAPYPQARLVFTEPQGFPASQLENADHLTVEGAAIYTQRLAGAVRESQGRGGEGPTL